MTKFDELRFDGRVAVVTGAGGGLGSAHALLLAARGAAVVVNDLPPRHPGSSSSSAALVVTRIAESGGTAIALDADVATEAGARDLIDAAVDRFGRLDIVVNNAGILRACDFGDMSPALFDEVLAANLRSSFLVAHAAWPHLTRQRYGRIISTTSNSGLLGTGGSTAYAAAKAGLWGLTRSLALEGAELDIHVNAIAPIAFTSMSASSRIAPAAWRSGEGDAWAARLDPEQVSPVVAWFAHERCELNGRIWSVAGGRVARFEMGLTRGRDVDTLTPERVRDLESDLLAEADFEFLDRASEEGRQLHRRLMTQAGRRAGFGDG